jgi:hypothetical protein
MALTKDDLYSLEEYARKRSDFRTKVIEHKDYDYTNDLTPAIRDSLTRDLH